MYREFSGNNFKKNIEQIKFEKFKTFLIDTYDGKIPKEFPYPNIDHWYFDFYGAKSSFDAKKCGVDFNDPDERFEYSSELMFVREIYTHFCSWSIITDNWISILAKLLENKKCIEIMAGSGLLSYALQKYYVDITPYDNLSWTTHKTYTKVNHMDAIDCAKNLQYDYIVCSWPPYEGTDICQVVKLMAFNAPRARIIYIGEDQGGCTACDDFFDITDVIMGGKDAQIINRCNKRFYQFSGIHDEIFLLKPNNKAKKYIKK